MNEAVEQMLKKYQPQSASAYENALKEILQEITLLALDRSGFFEQAAFYGGTALRILHGLDRFSEDLDFTLLKPNKGFRLDKYFSSLEREFRAFGFEFTLERAQKTASSPIESAFFKANTQVLFLNISATQKLARTMQKNQSLKIKFEVDTDPAIQFQTQVHTLLLPSAFTVKALDLPSLFGGKMHAALLRNWKTRVKGRDFYDVQWYLARKIPINKKYLDEKLKASNALKKPLTEQLLIKMFQEKVDSVDWVVAKNDVRNFLKDKKQIELWSADFFKSIIEQVRLV
jgi:predicted nucleotidyltransferase component of viral defense system